MSCRAAIECEGIPLSALRMVCDGNFKNSEEGRAALQALFRGRNTEPFVLPEDFDELSVYPNPHNCLATNVLCFQSLLCEGEHSRFWGRTVPRVYWSLHFNSVEDSWQEGEVPQDEDGNPPSLGGPPAASEQQPPHGRPPESNAFPASVGPAAGSPSRRRHKIVLTREICAAQPGAAEDFRRHRRTVGWTLDPQCRSRWPKYFKKWFRVETIWEVYQGGDWVCNMSQKPAKRPEPGTTVSSVVAMSHCNLGEVEDV
eukprot:RCo037370